MPKQVVFEICDAPMYAHGTLNEVRRCTRTKGHDGWHGAVVNGGWKVQSQSYVADLMEVR